MLLIAADGASMTQTKGEDKGNLAISPPWTGSRSRTIYFMSSAKRGSRRQTHWSRIPLFSGQQDSSPPGTCLTQPQLARAARSSPCRSWSAGSAKEAVLSRPRKRARVKVAEKRMLWRAGRRERLAKICVGADARMDSGEEGLLEEEEGQRSRCSPFGVYFEGSFLTRSSAPCCLLPCASPQRFEEVRQTSVTRRRAIGRRPAGPLNALPVPSPRASSLERWSPMIYVPGLLNRCSTDGKSKGLIASDMERWASTRASAEFP